MSANPTRRDAVLAYLRERTKPATLTLICKAVNSSPYNVGQILATLAMISLAWHAWIGVRDIWMDYVKPVGLRIFLLVLTILWLVGSVVYFVHILWRN